MYTIRIHCEYVTESLFDSLDCFIVKEKASRDHYQGIVKYKSQQALRQYLKRKYPDMKGNGAYSIKQCQEEIEDLITYYCKGTNTEQPIVIKNTLFPDIDIENEWKTYWEKNKELKTEKKASKKPLLDLILEEYPVIINHNGHDLRNAITSVVNYHVAHKKPLSPTLIENYANLILCSLDESKKELFIERLINQKKYIW